MSAAETIRAAIERLEEIREAPVPAVVEDAVLEWAKQGYAEAKAATYLVRISSERGIDAQLDILRSAAYWIPGTVQRAHRLAQAILERAE